MKEDHTMDRSSPNRRFHRLRLATASAVVLAVSGGAAMASPLALNVYKIGQFQGASSESVMALTGHQIAPPDMGGAVGGGYVAQMVNEQFSIYTPSGQLAAPAISLNTFYTDLGVNPNAQNYPDIADPRIIYDPTSQRWYASAITDSAGGVNNKILLAVSKSKNPLDGFVGYSLPAVKGNFADFPTLGVDSGAVTIATNNFGATSYNGTTVISIPKAQLVNGATALTGVRTFNGVPQVPFTPQPVTSTASGNTTTILSTIPGRSGVFVSTVSQNDGAAAALNFTSAIGSFSNIVPKAPTQPGGTAYDAGDGRMGASVYQAGNYIYAANTVLNASSDQIQWAVLNATTDALIKSGFVSLANQDLTYGSIAGNADGTFVLGFNGSGTTNNIGDFGTVCSVVSGACNAPSLLFGGLASNYKLTGPSSTRNRWGDYSATVVDPNNPNNFWLFEEYPVTNGSWGTMVTEVMTTVPEPGSLALLLTGVIGLAALVRRRKSHPVLAA